MSRRHFAFLAVPAALAIALTGCSAGSSGDSGSGPGSGAGGLGGGAGSALASCVQGHTWKLDVQDIAAQLLTQLQSTAGGNTFQSATGEGSQTMTWGTDGHVQIDTNYTFTMKATLSPGLVMTIKQTHSGPAKGTETITDGVAKATNWDNGGYSVGNVVDINGQTSSTGPVAIPTSDFGGVDLALTCSGNQMTTKAEAPGVVVTQKWNR